MVDTKTQLPSEMAHPSAARSMWRLWAAMIVILVLLANISVVQHPWSWHHACHGEAAADVPLPHECPAQAAINPSARPDITRHNVEGIFRSEAFRNLSVERLAGAVQIPTEDFEDMGLLGEDPRWDVFYDFQAYMSKAFPLLHEKLQIEVINEHNLVYTWKGRNATRKPVLLMAHQDVVPVAEDTLAEWTYPPFSGHFDGRFVYGRGSNDCKNNLVAIAAALTALLEQDFVPERTVVAAFGYDEEAGQHQYGAARIAQHLEAVYGENGVALVLDEGTLDVMGQFGRRVAVPQVSEKGYLDVYLDVHVPGGHSSEPPAHTSIGLLAAVVARLEADADANFPVRLAADDPFYALLQCIAHDAATTDEDMPPALREAMRDGDGDLDRVVDALLAYDPHLASLLHTTQAVTLFHAGSKANSLPAYAAATVNYRVSPRDTLAQVRDRLVRSAQPVAEALGLRFAAVGERRPDDSLPSPVPPHELHLSWAAHGLPPSPVSATTDGTPGWTALVGVIKHVFDEPGARGDVLVTPTLAVGNTDTRFFWSLSSQIYRFGPMRRAHDPSGGSIHDVNERMSLDAHLEAILFYHEFVRVFDEAEF